MLQEQVEKLNRQNTEHSHANTEADAKKRGKDAELIPDGPQTSASQTEKRKPKKESAEEEDDGDVFVDTEPEEEEEQQAEEDGTEKSRKVEDDGKKGEADYQKSSIVSDTSNLLHERYFFTGYGILQQTLNLKKDRNKLISICFAFKKL